MAYNIPNEIIHDIISYVPNMDIRINFGIFHKINNTKYNILNTIIRNKTEEDHISFKRYYCKENIFFKNHDQEAFLNDFVDLIYKEQNNKTQIEIQIWKLIKKDENFISHRNDRIYDVGDYDDEYYWKDVVIKYLL